MNVRGRGGGGSGDGRHGYDSELGVGSRDCLLERGIVKAQACWMREETQLISKDIQWQR